MKFYKTFKNRRSYSPQQRRRF